MCASKKTEEKESSLSGILATGFLMALFGAFLGFIFLSSFPLKAFSSLKEQATFLEGVDTTAVRPGLIYYFKGAQSSGNWESKRGQMLDGKSTDVSISDGDLNSWMSSKFRSGAPSSAEEQPSVLILPGVPNFCAINQDVLYISIPAEIVMFGISNSYQIFCKGHFSEGPTIKYVVDELRVNNASIPLTGGIAALVINTLLKAYSGTEEFAAMQTVWQRLESIELADNVIRLQLR
jgi:hypothetical protein